MVQGWRPRQWRPWWLCEGQEPRRRPWLSLLDAAASVKISDPPLRFFFSSILIIFKYFYIIKKVTFLVNMSMWIIFITVCILL